jgi:PncC family amidohydrolase
MTLALNTAQHLMQLKLSLTTAESCTGGLLANTLTNIPGASSFFHTGFITYANESKTRQLGVSPEVIRRFGAVSAQVALAMAKGARKQAKTSLAIALTGIAGPGGATEKKPVGLVFIALVSSEENSVQRCLFKGTRLQIKKQAVDTALTMLGQV